MWGTQPYKCSGSNCTEAQAGRRGALNQFLSPNPRPSSSSSPVDPEDKPMAGLANVSPGLQYLPSNKAGDRSWE